MKRWSQIGIAALCLLALPLLAQIWEATRLGEQQWELTTAEGEHISWHQTEAEANENGQAWSLDNGLAEFRTRHTGTRWTTTAWAQEFVLIQRSDLAGSCQVDCDPPAGGGGGDAEGTIFDRAYDGDSRDGAVGANETE